MATTGMTSYCFEDLALGQRCEVSRRVEEQDIARFAELSGDNNPVHLSDAYARTTRFGGRIAHGLFTASLVSAIIGTRLPGPGSVYLSQTLKFLAPVHLGDVVTVSVEIVRLEEKGRRCTLKCECRVGGKVVLEGEALVMVPARRSMHAA